MSQVRVARRYAEALLDLAEEQKELDRAGADLQVIQRAAQGSHELVLFLKSPVINKDKKRTIFAQLFKPRASTLTMNFLGLLIERGREDILLEIIDQFSALRDERQGIVHVEVKAATELTDGQTKQLQKRLESYTKKKVRFSFRMAKQLKGGFVAKVGDTVFDGSVQRQLELMKECFVQGAMGT